jgi:hypothetical protein
MSMKRRLAKLEKTFGGGPACLICRDSEIRPICIYEEEPDGSRRLVAGTPPAPCPACGKIPSGDGIWEVIAALPPDPESDMD